MKIAACRMMDTVQEVLEEAVGNAKNQRQTEANDL